MKKRWSDYAKEDKTIKDLTKKEKKRDERETQRR